MGGYAVASARTQPQFHRHFSLQFLAALSALLLCLVAGTGHAQSVSETSGDYAPAPGAGFFLLSDTSYGSDEVAKVRLEVQSVHDWKVSNYGGADIAIYRVPKPLEFLKAQKNLHRIQVDANYAGEGLANTLSFLWDSWMRKARRAWQDIFSAEARGGVTATAPELRTANQVARHTEFRNHPQFKPIKGFELAARFRYPLGAAKPIAPPKGLVLEGSSSEFIPAGSGNIHVPLGQLKPGLYLVEAIIGAHRATTLVFVSDTVAVTKIASEQLLVWTARRNNGQAAAGSRVVWTDGLGTLSSGTTNADGVVSFARQSPEQTYVIGEDTAGGAFISENFYYDSEIYNTKIYALTDRPLYRPGDEVHVRFFARDFRSARVSQAAMAGSLALTVSDPNGTPIHAGKTALTPESGAETRFKIPENATAGGYELRFSYRDQQYAAAFRVADYVKPHFEITVLPAKKDFKTGEPVTGRIQLTYPDGKPVADATVTLTLRGQQLSMVEAELYYSGQFPLHLETEELTTSDQGIAEFRLPPAEHPSRYILTVLAADGAAFRVKTTHELLIDRSSSVYALRTERRFTQPGEKVVFALEPVVSGPAHPAHWEAVHLETRARREGSVGVEARQFAVDFPTPGSYTLTLKDERGSTLGTTTHWVSGNGTKITPGSIEIVFDKDKYQPGETAEALITFPETVETALLTFERDKVEAVGLLGRKENWIASSRIADNQWQARIPVTAEHGPNITLSVAYVRHGDYVFQNRGLQVAQPQIALTYAADTAVYAPGELVTVRVKSTLDGKPAPATLAVGVVDEMIYVLQPEIAPHIFDFFYHPRRNNVRTSSSLSFISYDLATSRAANPPKRRAQERGVKVLERPRREEVDTAFWNGKLKTDAQGDANFTFRMPDSLTRWRITGRAMDAAGIVGQSTHYLRSEKPLYLKWTSPNWLREGDTPVASVAVFNQSGQEQTAEIAVGDSIRKMLLKPGANFHTFPLHREAGNAPLTLQLRGSDGTVIDALETNVSKVPLAWRGTRTQAVRLTGRSTPLNLPTDATQVRATIAQSASAHFLRIADDLIAYPWGCVEQTSSRLIPLSLAVQALAATPSPAVDRLTRMLQTQRLRLVRLAGPKAVFGWWGPLTEESALMTGYAYYAGWHASRTLGLTLPPQHWEKLLEAYQRLGSQEPLLHRALVLWWANEMGLPTRTLTSGLLDEIARLPANAPGDAAGEGREGSSILLAAPDSATGRAMALLLARQLAQRNTLPLPAPLLPRADAAQRLVQDSPAPVARALALLQRGTAAEQAEALLADLRAEMPTFDRAVGLVWLQQALGGTPAPSPQSATQAATAVALGGPWQKVDAPSGGSYFRLPERAPLPKVLELPQAPGTALTALVQYESAAAEKHSLPVQIERRLYALRAESGEGGSFSARLVAPSEALDTNTLYLDEVTLAPQRRRGYRMGIVEVPLPPGAEVEVSTWSMQISGLAGSEAAPLEAARHERSRYGYGVPVDRLDQATTYRHLVRFAQKGRFVLPPARYYRMYDPEQKAFEALAKGQRTLQVQ